MGEKNRKTFLVIFVSKFRQFEPHRVRFIAFDVPSIWDIKLLQTFIECHGKEFGIYDDHRIDQIFELTNPNTSSVYINRFVFGQGYGQDLNNNNIINAFIKVISVNDFSIVNGPYASCGYKNRSKNTSIIHIIHETSNEWNTDEIDETIQRYILTSNTVSSFNRISYQKPLNKLTDEYNDLANINDITLVFHDITLGDMIDILGGGYDMLGKINSLNLDLFIVDNSNQVYKIEIKNDGLVMSLCIGGDHCD